MYLEIMSSVAALASVAALLIVVYTAKRQRTTIDRLEDRMAHLIAGISLLTDTTEGGLRDVALEVGRLAGNGGPVRPRVRATQRRIATAVKKGRTVQDIAAAEQVSEGEVRLHLQLDKLQNGSLDAALF
jgi:hypothetical protein